jgi:phosphoglycerate dehydrogenase-like enzyme
LWGTTDWVGKRVGIAGYGSIGRQIARVFVAMGSEVVAYTASPRPTAESRRDHGYVIPGTGDAEGRWPTAWYSGTSTEALHTFLRQTLDALVIALPLTPATTKLFGTPEFEILHAANPSACFLVNISRGKIVDQPALVDALNGGLLRGAALDVTEPEPLPKDDPLWEAKNVVITPHMSALGAEYVGRSYDVLTVNLERLAKGEKLVNEVQRRRGY